MLRMLMLNREGSGRKFGTDEAVMAVRRVRLNAGEFWYPIVLQLHRFVVAIARFSVNHDGKRGSAPDPLVWDQEKSNAYLTWKHGHYFCELFFWQTFSSCLRQSTKLLEDFFFADFYVKAHTNPEVAFLFALKIWNYFYDPFWSTHSCECSRARVAN